MGLMKMMILDWLVKKDQPIIRRAIAQKRPTAQRNITTYIDYEITLDMAKEKG